MGKTETYDFFEDLRFPTEEYYGRFGWSDCTDRQELLAKSKPNCISQNYEALVKSGYPDAFPCRILGWIHIEPQFQKRGLAKARIEKFISESRSAGFKRIYLKAMYDWGPRWEADRDKQERYYERFGFICFRQDHNIRPMMLLNL